MRKLNLNQPILSIKGKPLKSQIGNQKDLTLREYFLILLASKFSPESIKESFWTTELGILCADEKNKEIELSEDKIKFLIRLLKNNKSKQRLPMGIEKETEIFFPFEQAQMLKALMTDKEIEEEVGKEAINENEPKNK